MKNKVGIIYSLIDPRYGIGRYVGQSVQTLEERFVKHVRNIEGKDHRASWIRKLLSLNLEPKPVLLAYDIPVPFITYLQDDYAERRFKPFYDYDALDKEEKLFISICREECTSFGIDCVNGNEGGHGERSYNRMPIVSWNKGLTKETDERIAKMAQQNRETWHNKTQEEKSAFCQKSSEIQIERYKDPLERQKLSHPKNEEGKKNIKEAQNRPEVLENKRKTGLRIQKEIQNRPNVKEKRIKEIRIAMKRPEVIAKLRQIAKLRFQDKTKHPMYGKQQSEESKRKNSESQSGFKHWKTKKYFRSLEWT